jgi:hypothetical protein
VCTETSLDNLSTSHLAAPRGYQSSCQGLVACTDWPVGQRPRSESLPWLEAGGPTSQAERARCARTPGCPRRRARAWPR